MMERMKPVKIWNNKTVNNLVCGAMKLWFKSNHLVACKIVSLILNVTLTRECTWDTWEEGRLGRSTLVPSQNCSGPCCSWSQYTWCTRQQPGQNHIP
jgi:hypothetical protein